MKTFTRVLWVVFIVFLLSVYIPAGKVFAKENLQNGSDQTEDCFPFSLCLEKQEKIKHDASDPFQITSSLLKEPAPAIKKEKNTNINSTIKRSLASTSNTHILNPEILFNLTNDYRIKIGLSPFQKEEKVCEIVKSRVNEIYNEIFVTGRLHDGFYAKNLPYFATENLIYAQTEERALKWWLNSPIHKAAITGNSKYSCLECSGNSCSQIFTSFDPKRTS